MSLTGCQVAAASMTMVMAGTSHDTLLETAGGASGPLESRPLEFRPLEFRL